MKIEAIRNCSFGSDDRKKNTNPIKYPLISGVAAFVGYKIPLKEIDGADIVSHVTSDGKQVLSKTKAPNIVGKWKNTLAGAFVGIGLATIYDLFTNHKKSND